MSWEAFKVDASPDKICPFRFLPVNRFSHHHVYTKELFLTSGCIFRFSWQDEILKANIEVDLAYVNLT